MHKGSCQCGAVRFEVEGDLPQNQQQSPSVCSSRNP